MAGGAPAVNAVIDDACRLTGVHMVGSVETALEDSIARSGKTRLMVIPEGPYVVPYFSRRA